MTIEQLKSDPDFQLLLALHHDEVIPFVQDELRQTTFTNYFFFGWNILWLIFMVVIAFQDTINGLIGWGNLMMWFGIGTVLVFILLIPPHEMIHGLAYRMVGAKKVSYGVNWKKLYFYAVADKFIVKRKSFIFIALSPFVTISVVVILTILFADVQMKWLLLGVLFMHSGACAGDFALLSFYERHRNFLEIFTYDDVGEHMSFFYIKDN